MRCGPLLKRPNTHSPFHLPCYEASKSPSLLRRSWFEPEAQRRRRQRFSRRLGRRRRRRRIGRGGGDGDGDGGASQGDARRIRRRCGTGGRRTPLEGSRYPDFLPPRYGRVSWLLKRRWEVRQGGRFGGDERQDKYGGV
ncbi:hypothetical protein DAI22_07g037000 [Oryza sativa Japonica Group]|nr:hypothetical protein DAI22_07g037000 [Oryza sativa Japonica Group]